MRERDPSSFVRATGHRPYLKEDYKSERQRRSPLLLVLVKLTRSRDLPRNGISHMCVNTTRRKHTGLENIESRNKPFYGSELSEPLPLRRCVIRQRVV